MRAVPKVAISIHAPRMGSDLAPAIRLRVPAGISIHAPRMGSDYACWLSARFHPVFQSTLPGWGATTPATATATPTGHFNPRSPDGERLFTLPASTFRRVFQSTLPGWGATGTIVSHDQGYYHFNPRSPDGERREADGDWPSGRQISIHAPRMGSDVAKNNNWADEEQFQSTLPGWGATGGPADRRQDSRRISIHAPRMGSDSLGI